MIITCEECSTSFNLDESLLKPEGSKVRCSKCRHIFTAFPPGEEDLAEPIVPLVDPDIEPDAESDAEPELISLDEGPEEEMDSDLDFGEEDDSPAQDLSGEDLDFSGMEFDGDFDDSDLEMEEEDSELEISTPSDDEANIEISFDDQETVLEIDADGLTLEMEDDSSLTMDFDQDLEMEEEDSDAEEIAPLDVGPEELEFDTEDIEFDEPLSMDAGLDMESPADEPELQMEEPDSGIQELEPDESSDLDSGDDAGLLMEDQEPEFELDFDEDQDLELEPDTGLSGSEDLSLELDPSEEITLEADSEDQEELEVAEEEEPDFSGFDEVLEQDVEPEIEPLEEEEEDQEEDFQPEAVPAEPEEPESARPEKAEAEDLGLTIDSPRRTRRKKSALGTPVILLLLVFLITAGAYAVSIFMGYKIPFISEVKIPFIEQFIAKDQVQLPEPKPVPSQKNVNGRFVSNDTAGELFIITGKVDNPAQVAYQYIQVKGTLLTKGKIKAMTQTAYCGNIISEETLKSGNIADINKQLAVKEGLNGTNLNIKPGGSVPFMLVFSNLPENLQNFTVEVEGFSKVGETKK